MSMEKQISFRTNDGQDFLVERSVAVQSCAIRSMVEEGLVGRVPLPEIDGKTFAAVLTFLEKHADQELTAACLERFDANFVKQMNHETIFQLTLAAHYLEIESLIRLTSQKLADDIHDMSIEEIRELFNIENDYTPEEEKHLRLENSWAFD